jgi:putative transposon-encoded protein
MMRRLIVLKGHLVLEERITAIIEKFVFPSRAR